MRVVVHHLCDSAVKSGAAKIFISTVCCRIFYPQLNLWVFSESNHFYHQTIFMNRIKIISLAVVFSQFSSCEQIPIDAESISQPEVLATFNGNIDLSNLENYANQEVPDYITRDNSDGNPITDATATLGRVLFYDQNLSVDNSISCSSCHQQAFAFSDNATASEGVNGNTGRHSMRLVNARFSDEDNFFWDERAGSLEEQTTMPIQDHAEMGFSGSDGDPSLSDLLTKLEGIGYYQELFSFSFGDPTVTEARIQTSLSAFIRSIQSFDSPYDEGRSTVQRDQDPFPNFTQVQNDGKMLFTAPPVFDISGTRIDGGAGCMSCHRAPEFDIDPDSRNNGVIGTLSGTGTDFDVTRSPSLRDVVRSNGESNGPFMHIGASNNLMTVIEHYDQINSAGNPNIDNRLTPGGNAQSLNLTVAEKESLVAFIRTLGGTDVYTNTKWSDPFE